ncbi:MAG: hypothetical protein INH43_06570 [Acidobacteriaceae bacterium]|nr:hypothetical protein [Acidobacteriaceae bacterium]
MDYPILKHLDVLIGLAVVMLLSSTVVAAATQLALNVFSVRARFLQTAMEELLRQVAPGLSPEDVREIGGELFRNRLLAPRRWFFSSRAEAVTREELVLCLLDMAAGRSGLAGKPDVAQKLRAAMGEGGIGSPVAVARQVYQLMLRYEREAPQAAAQVWRSSAVMDGAASDFTASLFAWYDNTTARAREQFSMGAKVAASVVALLFCFAVQLDSVDLLRRLSQDEKLRAAVVARADTAKAMYERKELDGAAAQAKMDAAVAELRDPKVAVIPDHFLWEGVAQVVVARTQLTAGAYQLEVGKASFAVALAGDGDGFAGAVRSSGAPVAVYQDKDGVRLVAGSAGVERLRLAREGAAVGRAERGIDWAGLGVRWPGVLLSWILLSLGAPFWYDVLKKALALRSLLVNRTEEETAQRQADQRGAGASGGLAARPGFDSTVQGTPDAVTLAKPTPLYLGAPERGAGVARVMPEGCVINVVGWVRGESVATAAGANIDKWYKTMEGEYFWAGDAEPPVA